MKVKYVESTMNLVTHAHGICKEMQENETIRDFFSKFTDEDIALCNFKAFSLVCNGYYMNEADFDKPVSMLYETYQHEKVEGLTLAQLHSFGDGLDFMSHRFNVMDGKLTFK